MPKRPMPTPAEYYLRKTRGLTPLEHGIYHLLRLWLWQHQPKGLPASATERALIVGAKTDTERQALEHITRKYLTWNHKDRSYKDAELATAIRAYAKRCSEARKNGMIGHKVRWHTPRPSNPSRTGASAPDL